MKKLLIVTLLLSCNGDVEVKITGNLIEAKRTSWSGDVRVTMTCPAPPTLVMPVVSLPMFVVWQKKSTLVEKPL